jgi:inhibitor of growth protein 5/inhibitor of growth protein 4
MSTVKSFFVQKLGTRLLLTLYFILAIEAVPLDLQRNFTLMRELDGYAQGKKIKSTAQNLSISYFFLSELMDTVSKDAIELIDNIKNMDPNARLDKLKNLTNILTETLKRGEEKVALAKSTFDAVKYSMFVF